MIPILMYHEISNDPVHSYAVTTEQFEEHLRFLAHRGYRSVALDEESFRLKSGGSNDSSRKVAITFDDAQISNYTRAFPLLKKYGFKATFFIPTAFIGQGSENLHRKHIVEMDRDGMSVQSHSHSHPFLDDLTDRAIESELSVSSKILEDIVQKKPMFLSCPGGRYKKSVSHLAGQAGYKAICVSDPGTIRLYQGTPILGRFLITRNTNLKRFEKICSLDPGYLMRSKAVYFIKNIAKRVVGNRLYHRVWKVTRS